MTIKRNIIEGFLNTVWPQGSTADTPTQRRKILAVRSAQTAMAAMVLAAVIFPILSGLRAGLFLRSAGLLILSAFYILLSWYGVRKPVNIVIGSPGSILDFEGEMRITTQTLFYFVVQLGLAGLICHQSFYGAEKPIAWLVLLPPIAHSVILLNRLGILLVCASSLALFILTIVSRLGWQFLPTSLLAFSFAVLFTVLFTLLAVSSEKAHQEVARLAGELSGANKKLREYAIQAEELAATRERNRLAGEIHDSLGHYLTVVNVQLEAARALHSSNPDGSNAALAKAQSLTLEGLKEIRRSVAAIRASPLHNLTLVDALHRLGEENRSAGLEVKMEIQGESKVLSPQVELTLYRSAQEGLTNVRKHAKTANASLEIDFRKPSRVSMRISDKGIGNATETAVGIGFGLLGIRERTQLLGGEMRIISGFDTGFTLEVELPI